MGREERSLMERLELALRFAPPLEAAEVRVGQPWFDLASCLPRTSSQRSTRGHGRDADHPGQADEIFGLRVTRSVRADGILVETDGRINGSGVELGLVLEHVEQGGDDLRLFGVDRHAGQTSRQDQPTSWAGDNAP